MCKWSSVGGTMEGKGTWFAYRRYSHYYLSPRNITTVVVSQFRSTEYFLNRKQSNMPSTTKTFGRQFANFAGLSLINMLLSLASTLKAHTITTLCYCKHLSKSLRNSCVNCYFLTVISTSEDNCFTIEMDTLPILLLIFFVFLIPPVV